MKSIRALFFLIILLKSGICLPQGDVNLINDYKEKVKKLFKAHDQLDSISYYLEEIIRIGSKNNYYDDYMFALIASTNISYIQEDYESMKCYALLSLNEGNKKIQSKNKYYGSISNNLGTYYSTIGDLKKAIFYTSKAVEFYSNSTRNRESFIYLMISLENLGIHYGDQGDIEKAVPFYKRVISLVEDSLNQEDNTYFLESIISCNYNIAIDYFSEGKVEESIFYYLKNLELFKKFRITDERLLIKNYISLANSYRSIKRFEKSFKNLELAKLYQDKYFRSHGQVPREENHFNVLAQNLADVGDFQNAIINSKKSIESCLETFPQKKGNPTCGDLYAILGEIYDKAGDIHNSLKYNHVALNYYSNSGNHTGNYHIKIPHSEFEIISQYLLEIVINKIFGLKKLYNFEGETLNLSSAYLYSQLLIQLSDRYRKQLQTLDAQLFISNELRPAFEQAIEIALKLHEITGEENYLEEAFKIAEKSKAVLLANSLNDTYAKYSGGVPDTLLSKERELKANLSFYKNQIFKERNKDEGIDSFKIDRWERKIFQLEREQENFTDILAESYPDYHLFLNQAENTNIKDLQKGLNSNTLLVEFFAGDSSLFIFYLDKQRLRYKVISSPENVYKHIEEFSKEFRVEGEDTQSFSDFKNSAFSLFDELIAEQISAFEKLIFIPDGQLGKIPFEFLLTNKENSASFKNLAYLGNSIDMQYAYSAKILFQDPLKRNRKVAPKIWGGFAPYFEGEKRLVFNGQEVEEINSIMQGDIFLDKEANLENTKSVIDQYKILHFATHGYSQMERPMYSRIEFTYQDSLEDGVFYAHDLMNHKINADLVVLSACETGEGKVAKGEGIMSFAWAFRYAGAPSILMSLWKAESSVSQRIMLSFYSYLKEGKSKTEALRLAKQDYIQNPIAGRAHPKYWANFILIGDDAPIFIDPRVKWVCLAGLLLFIGLVLQLFFSPSSKNV
ncbi:MAG: CHAT domain-containing protein [Bacteroidia bacterium]|nr:CHAT domain-containing protein [Bacteroidia bacterium]